MTSMSNSCFFVVLIVFAAFTFTTGKDAVKNEDLAEKLEKARQESAKLRQEMEMAKEETKQIIQRENVKLTAEAAKLRAEDSKLRKENKKLRRQDEELRKQDEELRQRAAELEQKVNELHQDNSEVKEALRQRDQNNTVEMQNVVRNSFGFRQRDLTSELKKTINKQIKEYLDENKMCVMGRIVQSLDSTTYDYQYPKIEFGQTFPRIPAFAAALSRVTLTTSDESASAQVYDFRVTKSSAQVTIYGRQCSLAHGIWIACL